MSDTQVVPEKDDPRKWSREFQEDYYRSSFSAFLMAANEEILLRYWRELKQCEVLFGFTMTEAYELKARTLRGLANTSWSLDEVAGPAPASIAPPSKH